MSVRLRPLVAGDARWADGWLADTARAVSYDAPSVAALLDRARREPALLLRAIERDSEPSGVLVSRVGSPARHDAIIELVAVAPDQARRGSGMTAAAALEGELRRAGVTRVLAPAPAAHGIAVYFWIRLGYRALLRAEWPCERDGTAWMRRDLVR